MPIRDWSQTAASNTNLEGISVGEGAMNISDFNNALRAMAAAVREVQASSTIASAATVNIGAANAEALSVTGTTTITAFDSVAAGVYRTLRFAGALTWTHNSTSMILPTGASISVQSGDIAGVRSLGSGNWRCEWFTRASGTALVNTGGTVTSITAGSGLSGGAITTTGTIALDISSLTEDTSPDRSADFVATYDASASGSKKVKLNELPGTIIAGASLTLDPYAANTTTTQAHGLGSRPNLFDVYLECKTAEYGYTTGQIIPLGPQLTNYGPSHVFNMRTDATNCVLITLNGSTPGIVRADTRQSTTITAANWKLIVTPFLIVT